MSSRVREDFTDADRRWRECCDAFAAAERSARGSAPVSEWLATEPDLARAHELLHELQTIEANADRLEVAYAAAFAEELQRQSLADPFVCPGRTMAAIEVLQQLRDASDDDQRFRLDENTIRDIRAQVPDAEPKLRAVLEQLNSCAAKAKARADFLAFSGTVAWFKVVREVLADTRATIAVLLDDYLALRRSLSDKHAADIAGKVKGLLADLEAERLSARERLQAARSAKASEPRLREFLNKKYTQYVANAVRPYREAVEKAAAARSTALVAILDRYQNSLSSSFLETDPHLYAGTGQSELRAELDRLRTEYVHRWCRERLSLSLEDEQARAVASISTDTLVTARAGSGKTSTLAARASFLTRHCQVSPNDLLLLAFNKKAALEMSERLTALGTPCPHAMTFHALAHALVHPRERIIYDDESGSQYEQSRVLQHVINGLLDRPEWRDRVRDLMLDRFRADWESLIGRGLGDSMQVGLAFRRSLVTETLDGDYVKSRGEQVIANCLFEHQVPYAYEKCHKWKERSYRPDFTLADHKVVIEYFGLEGEPGYDEQSQEKRNFWAGKPDWVFLEYGPQLLRSGGVPALTGKLLADLKAHGVQVRKLTDKEIWDRIRERIVTNFARTLRMFVGRCRKSNLGLKELGDRIRAHATLDDTERRFLDLATEAYHGYLARLQAETLEDFDGLMGRAVQKVESGVTAFRRSSGDGDLAKIRFVLVDEFQDMSPLFIRLLQGIRKHNPEVNVFGVGDDWQAINAFAGSDLRYFNAFEDFFGSATLLRISTNYRSAAAIVEAGNLIMAGRGAPARARSDASPGRVIVADLDAFPHAAEEENAWPGDRITPAVRRIIQRTLMEGKTIALLARRDGVPGYIPLPANSRKAETRLDGLYQRWTRGLTDTQKKVVAASTAHSYKGREADVVIVVDAVDRSYPLIHPDWVFARIFGDNPEKIIDDERRLFYVACTRAKQTLILLTDRHRESEFLKEIRSACQTLNWSEYPPFVQASGGWIVKVGAADGYTSSTTFDRRELLKAHRYRFKLEDWPHWWTTFGDEIQLDGVLARIQSSPWLRGPDGLEVRICKSDGSVVETLTLIDGRLG